MITKTFKTITGKLQVSIPGQLAEITLGQLIDMQSATAITDLDAIHILSGTPYDELKSIKNFADLQQFCEHIVGLSAQIKEVYNSDSLPRNVCFNIDGKRKKVNVIYNLAVQPTGAFLAAREIITEEISKHITEVGEEDWKESFNPSLQACALVLAHYFYCPATGNAYKEYEAEQFVEEIKKLPFTDALPIAKCFFLNYPNLSKPRISFWHRVVLLWKKRPELSSFKNSGMLIR